MVTDTRERIVAFVRQHGGQARVHELIRFLGLGAPAVHRQLKKLVATGILAKVGKPPSVFYRIAAKEGGQPVTASSIARAIDETYLYVSPAGELMEGVRGFAAWASRVGRDVEHAMAEYVEARTTADRFITTDGWIDATEKIKGTFDTVWVDRVFYRDFYALPTFGKTKLGQLVLYGKQAQQVDLVHAVADQTRSVVQRLISTHGIQAVGFLPHSLPRKIQFLKEYARDLALKIPTVQLVKAYAGKVPVAQKTLPRLVERVENARNTIFVQQADGRFDVVLLIDDAVGSGATLNETARKLKEMGIAKTVIGFAVVGSMKGFEVIPEV